MIRYAVIRVPTFGPPALIAEPNIFKTQADAQARIDMIEAKQIMSHHTHLECVPISGPIGPALAERGILV
jgi:hypothetical protein